MAASPAAACCVSWQISLQLVNCTLFLVPNVYVLTHECAWFNPVVIWSGFIRCAPIAAPIWDAVHMRRVGGAEAGK